MRTFLVALFVMPLLGFLIVPAIARGYLPMWFAGAYALAYLSLIPIALVAALRTGWRNLTLIQFRSPEKRLERLKATGQLTSTSYQAVRAFRVEESEDEGLIFFLELVDGSVLFLCGQYLYEYALYGDDPSHLEPSRFPCTAFTLHRHKTEKWVAMIDCQGSVLEPEVVTPPFNNGQYLLGSIPDDGDIFTDRTYDEFKRRMLQQKA